MNRKNALLYISILTILSCNTKHQNDANMTDKKTSTEDIQEVVDEKRVTGIGGIFFKCEDPEKMKKWYSDHLGFNTDQYGGVFEWRKTDKPDQKAYTVWSPFSEKTNYFEPSEKEFMINYRVQNIERLIEQLKEEGIEQIGDIETYEYGKFAWIVDPEGNKIELWEPIDSVFTNLYDRKTMF